MVRRLATLSGVIKKAKIDTRQQKKDLNDSRKQFLTVKNADDQADELQSPTQSNGDDAARGAVDRPLEDPDDDESLFVEDGIKLPQDHVTEDHMQHQPQELSATANVTTLADMSSSNSAPWTSGPFMEYEMIDEDHTMASEVQQQWVAMKRYRQAHAKKIVSYAPTLYPGEKTEVERKTAVKSPAPSALVENGPPYYVMTFEQDKDGEMIIENGKAKPIRNERGQFVLRRDGGTQIAFIDTEVYYRMVVAPYSDQKKLRPLAINTGVPDSEGHPIWMFQDCSDRSRSSLTPQASLSASLGPSAPTPQHNATLPQPDIVGVLHTVQPSMDSNARSASRQFRRAPKDNDPFVQSRRKKR